MANHEHSNSNEPHPLKYVYYAADEVLLHFEHETGWLGKETLTTRDIYDLLIDGTRLPNNQILLPNRLREITFELDHVGTTFNNPETNLNQTLFLLRAAPTTMHVARTINDFNIQINTLKGENNGIRLDQDGKTATFRQSIPNWYSGGSSHLGLGTSGSGQMPRPVQDADTPARRHFQFGQAFNNKIAQLNNPCNEVDVFILDTIPPKDRLKNALTQFPLLAPYADILTMTGGGAGNYSTPRAEYIYASAMGQNFDATVEPYEGDPEDPIVMEHQFYDSSDHGLFIAGIVHDIAPQAQLYVIEVLNKYGIGTFWNIAAGFRKVLEIRANQPQREAIINCSLTLSFPTRSQYGYSPDFTDTGLFEFMQLVANHTPADEVRPIGLLVNEMSGAELDNMRAILADLANGTIALLSEVITNFNNGALIISAAGNDSDRPNDVRPPRFFAITPLSTGIGALRRDLDFAGYSNDNDVSGEGFYTFGGDYSDAGSTTDSSGRPVYADVGHGVIGIFLADFEHFTNLNGYAEWAGTSFAAPIISGAIAKGCLATCKTPQEVRDAIVQGVSKKDETDPTHIFYRFEEVDQVVLP